MAGHSKFKNIMYRKGAQDKKRSKQFSKLSKEITVAAKMGMPDPDHNPRLRAAVLAARALNMPKDNIDRAIKKSQTGEGDNFEDIRYEGYGPGGVAVIVEALTDNRNRTASEVRTAFSKNGGNLGETGAVSFMFDQRGVIVYGSESGSADAMLEAALEAGAEDCESSDESHEFLTAAEDLHAVGQVLETQFGAPQEIGLQWRPQNLTAVSDEQAEMLFRLIDTLEDLDDVQKVYANYDVSDAFLERYQG